MKKFKVALSIYDGGQKITAIKQLRILTGWGLSEAKTFIEENNGRDLVMILNAAQIANMLYFHCNTENCVCYYITNVTPFEQDTLDISGHII